MKKTCFFVSRIGEPGSPEREFSDKLLKYIVEPVLEKAGYEKPVRADHITQPGVITTQVFTRLWNDDLVIADLTGGNPNVFYELAVRHIRRLPFIHLIQAGDTIPFDIAPNRTIEFTFDIEQAEIAKTMLARMIEDFDYPAAVQTPLSAAVDFSTVASSANPLSDAMTQILSIVQEIRFVVARPLHSTDSPPVSDDALATLSANIELAAENAESVGTSEVALTDLENARKGIEAARRSLIFMDQQGARTQAENAYAWYMRALNKLEIHQNRPRGWQGPP